MSYLYECNEKQMIDTNNLLLPTQRVFTLNASFHTNDKFKREHERAHKARQPASGALL